MIDEYDSIAVSSPPRDRVGAVDGTPTIVSISDIHGYLGDARSALLTLSDHPAYDPIVETDPALRLQWAGNDYVLVFNGDLIDRGPQNERVLETVARLIDQAPPGRVRVTLGNHEMGILTPDRFGWDGWFSNDVGPAGRRTFLDRTIDGHVVAAYDGYNVTYAHAGQPEPYDVAAVNDHLAEAATQLRPAVGTAEDAEMQARVIEEYPRVLGLDGATGRGANAGLAWLDFKYMPEDAPPQVVGHTRQNSPIRRGSVVCGNVIRNNRRKDGGEGVIVETPDSLVALNRTASGGVKHHEFSLPEKHRD